MADHGPGKCKQTAFTAYSVAILTSIARSKEVFVSRHQWKQIFLRIASSLSHISVHNQLIGVVGILKTPGMYGCWYRKTALLGMLHGGWECSIVVGNVTYRFGVACIT